MGTATSRRKVSSGPSRRGFRYSEIDHSSARRFSTGVPVSAPREPDPRGRGAPGGGPAGGAAGGGGRGGPPGGQGREELDGLAEPHVVGEAGAEAEVGHLHQPAQAALLVGTEYAVKVARDGRAARGGAVPPPGDPAGAGAFRDDVGGPPGGRAAR